jgi:hypothetical protein
MADASPTDSARTRRCCVAIVASLFVLYNLNFREIGVLDPVPATLLPASLLTEGDADLDEFRELLASDHYGRNVLGFGAVQERDGHLVSSYPIGAAVLAAPFYALPVWLGWLEDWRDYRLVAKLAASLMVALSAGLLFLAGAQLAGAQAGLVAALAYGAASNAWTVGSQALWQHGPGMLCLSAALLLVLRLERGGGAATAFAAGAALGLAVACRSLNAIPSACLGLFVLVRHTRLVPGFALPLLAVAVWQAWYNLSTFGDLRGGYDAIYQSQWHAWRGLSQDNALTHPLGQGFLDVLLSPSKGLLVYTPWAAFALVGLAAAVRATRFPLGRYLALWVLLVLVVLAKNQLWWGGSGFGPRYLCEALTALALAIAWLWPRMATRPVLRTGFATCVALGFAVQVIGAFTTPCGWHDDPVVVDRNPSRLWDWRDPQLLRCLRAGPRQFEFLASSSD